MSNSLNVEDHCSKKSKIAYSEAIDMKIKKQRQVVRKDVVSEKRPHRNSRAGVYDTGDINENMKQKMNRLKKKEMSASLE